MPQLSVTQNAIPAQPGMPFDAEAAPRDVVSVAAAVNIPFGVLCELNASGLAQPVQSANLPSATMAASTAFTFASAVTLPAGQGLTFGLQPGVVYYLASAINNGTAGTLTAAFGGTTGAQTAEKVPYLPQLAGISLFDPLGVEQNYVTWSLPTTLAGTVSVSNNSASITFSTNQTLAQGTQLVFSSQPGVIYQLAAAVNAATAATLVTKYSGVTAGAATTQLPALSSTAVGWRQGQAVPFMRRGRIWVAGDNGGTATRTGPINVWHSSTGANPQGVFTFSPVALTVGGEIDIAPYCQIWNPNALGAQYVDPFGNAFTVYPVEINA